MLIYTDGCRESYCQLPRIEKEFVSMGHVLTDKMEDADLLYVNNAWYDDIIKNINNIHGIIVFNVLDLAPHIKDFPLEKLKHQLRYADIITCISETVQKDLFNRTGYKANIIYQPIQNITRSKKVYNYKYLFCGRVGDANKRTLLGVNALNLLKIPEEEVITVGSEYNVFGQNAGLVSEEVLNDIFNSVDYVIFPSKEEGIGLPAIEAMAVGSIPIVCNDLSTLKEFFPEGIYEKLDPTPQMIAGFINYLENNQKVKEQCSEGLYHHYLNNLQEKFSPAGVVKRILEAAKPALDSNIKAKRIYGY
jgi:hypothetical protein